MSPASMLRHAGSLLPSLADYREARRSWPKDLLAGVTVGIVALPLALGFGVSSGLTAEQGLVTAIVAGLLAAIFGGSNVQRSEEHTSELQSRGHLVCRLLLEKKN